MKQSSNWPLVILDHKKMKSLKWRFLELLLHLFLLTYLMLNSSRHLLQHLHAAVLHLRAAVLHLHSQQQLIRLQLVDKTYNPYLSKKMMKIQKMNKRPLSIQG